MLANLDNKNEDALEDVEESVQEDAQEALQTLNDLNIETLRQNLSSASYPPFAPWHLPLFAF